MEEETVKEARERLAEVILTGGEVDCPCCDQFCKLYPRSLNRTQARGLIWLFRIAPDRETFINVPKLGPRWLISSNQIGTVHHWGLIESKASTGGAKNSGLWRLTPKGVKFVTRQIEVPKKAYIYNNKAIRFSDELIGIDAAITNKFSYEELMTDQSFLTEG